MSKIDATSSSNSAANIQCNDAFNEKASLRLSHSVKSVFSSTVTSYVAGKGSDILDLSNYMYGSFVGLMSGARQVGNDVALELGDGKSLTIKNVELATLTASDLRFERSS